jgi:hypothetical protein
MIKRDWKPLVKVYLFGWLVTLALTVPFYRR